MVTTTCASPSPNTSRRISLRRSNDNSSPMVNRSATTPKAASLSIESTLIANALSQCACSRQRAESIRSERDAREEIAEHRADPEPEEQRRDDAGRHKEQQCLFVEGKIDGIVHGGQLSRFEPAREPRGAGAYVIESDDLDATRAA